MKIHCVDYNHSFEKSILLLLLLRVDGTQDCQGFNRGRGIDEFLCERSEYPRCYSMRTSEMFVIFEDTIGKWCKLILNNLYLIHFFKKIFENRIVLSFFY